MRIVVTTTLAFGLAILPVRAAAPEPAPAGAALTLADAIGRAEAASPALAAANAAREAAAARGLQARLDRIGRLEAALQWNPSLRNPAIPLGAGQTLELPLAQTRQFSLGLDQPLWTWGALRDRVRAANQAEQAESLATVRERQDLRFRVTRAYLAALEAEAALGVAERALEQQEAFLATARSRVRAGQAPRLDELKAELAVSSATSERVGRRNGARIAREELVAAASDPALRAASLVAPDPAALPEGSEEQLVEVALARRPDLAARRREGSALRLDASAQRASGLPAVALVAGLSQQSGDLAGWMGQEARTYHLGLAVRWEGLAPVRARARGAERESLARREDAQARALADQVRAEVRSARLQVENALAQVELADTALRQAQEQARVARMAYREGVTTAVEAQDAELALTRAGYQQVAAALERDLGLAKLEWVAGTR
jgi:outer membrane protein TolC